MHNKANSQQRKKIKNSFAVLIVLSPLFFPMMQSRIAEATSKHWTVLPTNSANFSSPAGIAFDSSGNLYAANYNNAHTNAVDKLTKNGTSWSDISGTSPPFNAPTGIAVDGSGDIFVSDSAGNTIYELKSGSSSWTQIQNGSQSSVPYALATNGSGNVFVTNFYNSVNGSSPGVPPVEEGTANSSNIWSWTALPTSGGSFSGPYGIAVDSHNNVFVADDASNQIEELENTGSTSSPIYTSWKIIGKNNVNGGNFNSPYGIAVDSSGNVFVTNWNPGSGVPAVEELTNGNWTDITFNGGFAKPGSIAVDSSGNVYVADAINNTIQKLSLGGTQAQTATPTVSAVTAGATVVTGTVVANATVTIDDTTAGWSATGTATSSGTYSVSVPSGKQLSANDAITVTALASGETVSAAAQITVNVLGEPTDVQASHTTSTETTLSWNPVMGSDSYTIYENDGSTPIATGITSTSYSVSNLMPGTSYTFTVRAVNTSGDSSYSSAITVNTAKIGSVSITPSHTNVLSGNAVTVNEVVYDVYHNPVANAIVDLSSSQGSWSSQTVTANVYGAFSATWTAPRVTSLTSATVTASVYGTVYGAVPNVPTTTLTFTITPPPTISTTALSGGSVGTSYLQTLVATGGFEPYSWSITTGYLPNGLSLDSRSGVISGTPTESGANDFTVQVKDANGNTATQPLSISVNKPTSPSNLGGSSNNSGSSNNPNNGYFNSAIRDTVNVTSGTPTTVNVQGSYISVQSTGTPISGDAVVITTQSLNTIPQITANFPLTANVTAALGVHYTGTGFPVKVTISNPSIHIGSAIDEWVNGKLVQVPATVANGQMSLQISSNSDLVVISPYPMILYPNVREIVWNGQPYGYQAIVKKDPNTGINTTYMPIWYVMQVLNQAGIYSAWNGHTWSLTTSNPSTVTSSGENSLSKHGNMTITVNGKMSEQVLGFVGEDMIHDNKTTFMPIWYVMQILKQAGVHSDWTGSMWAMYPKQ